MIDPRAVVHDGARLDADVSVGPFAIVGPNVRLGAGTTVGAHAVVEGRTTVGQGCRIFPFAAVGSIPQDLKYAGEDTRLEIGDRTTIREYVTVNIGTEGGGGVTRVGSDCLLMAYAHVAHDCLLGDRVILANAATLGGHVVLGDWAIIGGLSAVHQFVRVGEHAIVGGCSAVVKDVPPFVSASGNRAKLFGLNLTGLKRRQFDDGALKALRRAYRTVFQGKGTLAECLDAARAAPEYQYPEVQRFVAFIAESERGVTR